MRHPEPALFDSPKGVQNLLRSAGYLAGDALSMSLFLSVRMQRPLLLEGAPGVGKTELAKALAEVAQTDLIRLQCYEGLDLGQAAYEWNYPRQLLELSAWRSGAEPARPSPSGPSPAETRRAPGAASVYSEEFLLKRPLLAAIDPTRDRPAVLLIDELDRADEEFESFLLELLSDFQITIPELGTVRAAHRPWVILTSNRTRAVHDALRRRCLYHFVQYPDFDTELAILLEKVPRLGRGLARQIVQFAHGLRQADLQKPPGVSESIDWAQALHQLGLEALSPEAVAASLGCVLKYREDIERIGQERIESMIRGEAASDAEAASF